MNSKLNADLPAVIIGGGPAGLMAAQVLSEAGRKVHVFDAMPSVGRKFLLAGKGGLNLTHSENADAFSGRFGARRAAIESVLNDFDALALQQWSLDLGIPTFVGTSGRVFPTDMKAAPLLRAWLQRLRHPTNASAGAAVEFHMRHRWTGWDADQALTFETPQGEVKVKASAVVLALGGGSWSRLGSNGAWVSLLAAKGVAVSPLLPSNCGFDVSGGWSPFFKERFAGQPFKSVAISVAASDGSLSFQRKGEFVATATGVEGSLIYAASSVMRDTILQKGEATFYLDLLPDMPLDKVSAEIKHPRGSRSLSNHLKSRLHLDGIKTAILHERLSKSVFEEAHANPQVLANAIKTLPIHLQAFRPIDEAISSAGGVLFEVLNADLMLEQLPGVFCAGEMLDWEASTGGYLLNTSMATGRRAAFGVLQYLEG